MTTLTTPRFAAFALALAVTAAMLAGVASLADAQHTDAQLALATQAVQPRV